MKYRDGIRYKHVSFPKGNKRETLFTSAGGIVGLKTNLIYGGGV
jgi:hypothetical protein